MSRELLDFLRARLKDDEDYARNAYADHNDAGPNWYEQWSGALNIGEEEDLVLTNDSAISRFMARHDPARVLREVEAKRAVLNAYLPPDADVHPGLPCINFEGQDPADYDEYDSCSRHLDAAPRLLRSNHVLRLLALSYADHSDYRDEWRLDDTR
ncbi:DUF6221 family protein [Streptomyces sp. W4I9-2]|uniref:DUF6221 family protein n=1 Tax=Streptomyces sp. W4I9-2 TaxID=3042297 RepID=UPI0027801013|nr:DUF6221 family protein [Streptomyces sp. W4I9-2]MDQ0694222.1 hypothetical protein [Streptomyces sp. W4I9-2]